MAPAVTVVVATQIVRGSAFGEKFDEPFNDTVMVYSTLNIKRQTFPAVFIHNAQQTQRAAIVGPLLDKVVGPDMVLVGPTEAAYKSRHLAIIGGV